MESFIGSHYFGSSQYPEPCAAACGILTCFVSYLFIIYLFIYLFNTHRLILISTYINIHYIGGAITLEEERRHKYTHDTIRESRCDRHYQSEGRNWVEGERKEEDERRKRKTCVSMRPPSFLHIVFPPTPLCTHSRVCAPVGPLQAGHVCRGHMAVLPLPPEATFVFTAPHAHNNNRRGHCSAHHTKATGGQRKKRGQARHQHDKSSLVISFLVLVLFHIVF